MAGQYLDMLEQAGGGGSVDRAAAGGPLQERQVHASSGRCCSAPRWPARGAALLAAYSAYGLPLGEAFQLRDDVLGVFGDPARPASRPATTCARASGPCCRAGRPLEQRGPGAGRWSGISATRAWTPPAWPTLREVIVATGALAAVERMIDAAPSRRVAALAASPVDPAPRSRCTSWPPPPPPQVLSRRRTSVRTVIGPTDRVVVVGAGLAACPRRCAWPAPAARSPCSSASAVPGGRTGRLPTAATASTPGRPC